MGALLKLLFATAVIRRLKNDTAFDLISVRAILFTSTLRLALKCEKGDRTNIEMADKLQICTKSMLERRADVEHRVLAPVKVEEKPTRYHYLRLFD